MHDTLTPATIFPSPTVHERTIALKPEERPLQTEFIQGAMDSLSKSGGGRVVLKAGRYVTGSLMLRSGVELHLEKGALLLASGDLTDYHRKERTTHGSSPNEQKSIAFRENRPQVTAVIFAEGAENIALTGEGVIDGNGEAFYAPGPKSKVVDWIEAKKACGTWVPSLESNTRGVERPFAMMLLINCRGVRLEGLRIQNPPRWTIHTLACDDLVFRGLSVYSPVAAPNGDGIDLDGCCNVLVEDCEIATSDDAICLKNTGMWDWVRPSRNITVRRCRLHSTTHAFTTGTESLAAFENVEVSDLEIAGHEGHKCITAIGLAVFQGGDLRNVHISGVTMSDVVLPLYIRVGTQCLGKTGYPAGQIEDVVLDNVTVRGATGNCFLLGLPEKPLRNVVIRNVDLEFAYNLDSELIMRQVPELVEEYADNRAWRQLPAYGFFCRHIHGLELRDIRITNVLADARPALIFKNVDGLSCGNVHAPDPV